MAGCGRNPPVPVKRIVHIIAISLAAMACGIAQHRLDVRISPTFAGKPLAFDTLALETTARQSVSVTRCDLLLSSAQLRREDGTWIAPDHWAAFVSTREGRNGLLIR